MMATYHPSWNIQNGAFAPVGAVDTQIMPDDASAVTVRRATLAQQHTAFALAQEYFSNAGVVAREDQAHFGEEYFGDGRGFWLAEANGQLAGCVGLRKLPMKDDDGRNRTDCAEIKRMYLRDEFRGRGIAQQLLEAAQQFARHCGYAWIYLDTANDMIAAARLYQRNGFVPCERYNQNPQAAIFMRKSLGSDT